MHTVSEFSDDEIVSRTADPYESFNKRMYRSNYEADRFLFLPLVNVYETAAPGFVQTGVSNFFANLREIPIFFNCILQERSPLWERLGDERIFFGLDQAVEHFQRQSAEDS